MSEGLTHAKLDEIRQRASDELGCVRLTWHECIMLIAAARRALPDDGPGLTIDEIEAELRRRARQAEDEAHDEEEYDAGAYSDGKAHALRGFADWIAQQRKERG